ncbi:class I SAM-dependent methyltransferase [Ectothiorhodospira sp. 9100]|uniref:class I SAM-dependent methyltransferase n=1 Tax=unclassified Ectothiorhodospira TaxID=2684909 RepID=UPI001EE7D026|nr:methyltransferase domain-containing protein [Ectothiorhodospira sp. 9100]MCG5519767.1 methyltransferase domain-containing protein [Ectothiorhodospira sp. 9905]
MEPSESAKWQTRTRSEFVEYYARQSLSAISEQRSRELRDKLLKFHNGQGTPLNVADIGCNAGTQSRVWAELGHHVYGVDINEDLVRLAHTRITEAGLEAAFHIASATSLPFADASMDICIAPELLEHVADWQQCLAEFARILAPGGVLYISTTNRLCPVQNEYDLPLYSWYPASLKRRYEHLAVTTRPELANYATYPAVNWFTYYQLRDHLKGLGMESSDRFDNMERGHSRVRHLALSAIRVAPPIRWLAHVTSPSTSLLARKVSP